MPLEARDGSFFLDGKKLRLLSGAIHYFRVVPQYWEDRLLRLKACGLNCVETYVPWNLHEQIKGQFNFEGILNLRKFIEIAQKLKLLVILRPGPYICAEWDFGGLPSWLLRDADMKVRCAYEPYLNAVENYLTQVLSCVGDLQHTKNKGPIIAVQVENEYGSYGNDAVYKTRLTEILHKVGVTELLFTSENGMGIQTGHIPGVLSTCNFQERDHGLLMFEYLKHVRQPGMPLMVMEFWTGWFDHWGEKHHVVSNEQFEQVLRWILNEGGSVNFYMFHGGTNFGFTAGANEHLGATNDTSKSMEYMPDVTSYDYDAPVAENGDLTEKYFIIQKVLRELVPDDVVRDVVQPPMKVNSCAYGEVKITGYLPFSIMLQFIEPLKCRNLMTMEQLPINDESGQSFGFVLYEKDIKDGKKIVFPGKVKDRAIVLLNYLEVETIDWSQRDHVTRLDHRPSSNTDPRPSGSNRLQILVENCGRVNYADFNSPVFNNQRKGLNQLEVDGNKDIRDWNIYPLEFGNKFITAMTSCEQWMEQMPCTGHAPCLCRANINVSGEPMDTFINMTGWKKGIVFINGFNIGRYWEIGPQQTLYVPGPLLRCGDNQLLIFELHSVAGHVTSSSAPVLGETVLHQTIVPLSARIQLGVLKKVLGLGGWVWPILRLFMK